MGRTYPPIWCKKNNCTICNLKRCNRKILHLFEPYKYSKIDFKTRRKQIEITTIAIFFGFCKRLAKYCLLFPQDAPINVVRNNFINSTTGLPTDQSIQRIFLDMLSGGNPKAPTDKVHRYRLLLASETLKTKRAMMVTENGEVEMHFGNNERENFKKDVKNWFDDLLSERISFEKTSDSELCKFCFLKDCDASVN